MNTDLISWRFILRSQLLLPLIMPINPIIFGSTGMVGQAVLLECLEDINVQSILLINRRPVHIRHEKVKEIIHLDFNDFSSLTKEFSGYDTCFFCLGISSVGLSEEEYHRTTYDITIRAAETLSSTGKPFIFCYVSGAGTDSSEKGRSMWARVKGKTENKLFSLFEHAYMFRPGYIQPLKGIRSRTWLYNAIYAVFTPAYFLLKPFKSLVTDTTRLGKAMIRVVTKSYEKKILENRDINKLASDN
jgi:uncharacterized protein YbjT (DUF2867 family)